MAPELPIPPIIEARLTSLDQRLLEVANVASDVSQRMSIHTQILQKLDGVPDKVAEHSVILEHQNVVLDEIKADMTKVGFNGSTALIRQLVAVAPDLIAAADKMRTERDLLAARMLVEADDEQRRARRRVAIRRVAGAIRWGFAGFGVLATAVTVLYYILAIRHGA